MISLCIFKKTHENVKCLLETKDYNNYKCQVCDAFKIISFLKGLQGGYTKHCKILAFFVLHLNTMAKDTGLK